MLPLKIRWLAHPRVPTGRISEVDFLVDGKLRCVERYAPYNYGSDDRHGHLGYLVTTWLAPGKHRFTVRVVLATGPKASHTVVARVLPAPKPPAALAGKWRRMVTADPKLVPSGIWEIVFDRIGSWDLDLVGSGIVEHVVVRPNMINIDAPLWMTPEVDGHFKLSRYGHTVLARSSAVRMARLELTAGLS